MLPVIAARASSREGCGFAARSAVAAISCPEVQKPHCGASCATNDFCSALSSPFFASPSTVWIERPSIQTASWLHE